MEEEIYQILKKHNLPLKKREEILTDLLSLLNIKAAVCEHPMSYRERDNKFNLKCTKCGAVEIDSMTPRTTYACGSSDYDQRPNTFSQSEQCRMSVS
jgi:hypothetical protein